jgi:hypothetical protein
MISSDYLTGHLYHMVHYNNLSSIFRQGMILSNNELTKRTLSHRSIAAESVQNLRKRIFIRESPGKEYRLLHTYVPFYFAVKPPMLYVQRDNDLQDELLFLEMRRAVIQEEHVLFTDGNATIQQLSDRDHQKVGITAISEHNVLCQRIYKDDSTPHGTNPNRSDIYIGAQFLSRLYWDIINNPNIQTNLVSFEEHKRIRSAEVLIPDHVPLEMIQEISVKNHSLKNKVNELIVQYKLDGKIPFATVKPSLFL